MVFASPNTVLRVPWPFATLVVHSKWTQLAQRGLCAWGRDCDAAPFYRAWLRREFPDGARHNAPRAHDVALEVELLDGHFFVELADELRCWSSVIQDGTPAADREHVRESIAKYIVWLDHCARIAQPDDAIEQSLETRITRGGKWSQTLMRHVQYRDVFFVNALWFAFGLQNNGTGKNYVKQAFLKATRLLPAASRGIVQRQVEAMECPSPSQISRGHLYLDVALMLRARKFHESMIKDGAVVYGLSDSSPQGGRDYQITEYYALLGRNGELSEAGDAALKLKSFPKREDDMYEGQVDDMSELMRIINTLRRHHVFPPMTMGSKRTSLTHKAHCVVQQLRLETNDFRMTADLAELFFAWVNDSGTEKHFNRSHVDTREFYPHWHPAQVGSDNIGAGLDENGDNDDETIFVSFRHTLHCDGLFHPLENIQKRLLRHFVLWDVMKPRLESACVIFHRPSTRKRFRTTCMGRADQQEDAKRWFSHGPPLLEGGRVWGVTMQAAEFFHNRKTLIRANWSHERMGGARIEQEDAHDNPDQEDWAKETSAHLNKCHDGFADDNFWGFLRMLLFFSWWIAALEHWLCACPCHPRRLREFFDLRFDQLKCPLRTCRAPEIAMNALINFAKALLNAKIGSLMQDLAGQCAALSP
jgi:hypothetical protein